MSRKSKIDPYFKVELIEKYLRGEIRITEACRMAGLSDKTTYPFKKWINIYENEGLTGFLEQKENRNYSNELKLSAVKAYLNGEGIICGNIKRR